ncbi:unnamed protein product [Blepharisma stoltei]|uniref:Importin subunit alpha n=1 Tax=Blepharisma stoltei TaxID=1481888 RepID=A0AAU9IXP1_9CILI|nr:unnamed protein product [Blepharisma stoltei]
MIESRIEERNNNYQKLPDYSTVLQKREEGAIQLRKKKRTENTLKKRALLAPEIIEADPSLLERPKTPLNFRYSSTLIELCPALGTFDISPNDKISILFELIKKPQNLEITSELVKLLRKIFSSEQNPPLAEAVTSGVSIVLIELLRTAPLYIKLEAAWCIINLTCSPPDVADLLIQQGAAQALLENLDSDSLDLVDLCVWAFGNIATNSVKDRNMVIKMKIIDKLLQICERKMTNTLIEDISWVISCLTMHNPPTDPNEFYKFLDYLPIFFEANNNRAIEDSCKTLVFLTNQGSEWIDKVIKTGLLPKIAELLVSSVASLQFLALKILGNVATGDEEQTDLAINLGLADQIGQVLMPTAVSSVKMECLWAISNILAGTAAQVTLIINKPYFPKIVNLMIDSDSAMRKEAIWAISNATFCKDPETILSLLQFPVLEYFTEAFELNDIKIYHSVISAIYNILKSGQQRLKNGKNLAAVKFEELGGVEILEEIFRKHGDAASKKTQRILEEFYGIIEEDEEIQILTEVPATFIFS